MSFVSYENIRTAIRQRLNGTLSILAVPIAAGVFSDDLFTGAQPFTRAARAMIRPTFDVQITGTKRNEDTQNTNGPQWLYDVSIRVTMSYKLDAEVLATTDYETVKSGAESDIDRIQQALCTPGSVSQTFATAPTGICSGMLRHEGSAIKTDDPATKLYEVTHDFVAIVLTTVALS